MLDVKSRYYNIDTATFVAADGRLIAYKRRRFVPAGAPLILSEIVPAEGERLDLITARAIGDPELFWRLCDANNALSPFELLEERGRTLRIPMPQF